VTDLQLFNDEFLPNVEKTKEGYKKWAKDNPGEKADWDAYVQELQGGGTPEPPRMGSNMGRALVAAGQMAQPEPAPEPGPEPPEPEPGPEPPSDSFIPFSSGSAFNQKVPADPPIHRDSDQMLSASNWWLLDGVIRPSDGADCTPWKEWLGPRDRAYYWRGDAQQLPTHQVSVNYSDSVGYQCGASRVSTPMPAEWEPLFAGGSYDGIIWVVDAATGDSWESYRLTPPGTATMDIDCDPSGWNAVRLDLFPGEEKTGVGYGYGIGQSGSDILTGLGLLRPEHFLDLTPRTLGFALRGNWNCGSGGNNHPVAVGPAGDGDGRQPYGIPMGARVQLDPALDILTDPDVNQRPEPLRSALKIIGLTLQTHGIVGVDSSGDAGAGGIEAADHRYWQQGTCPWDGVGDYQRGIPYSWMKRFRVIDWQQWTGA
jgi:hypothetical protein